MTRSLASLVLVLSVLLGVVSCGDDAEQPSAQPATDEPIFIDDDTAGRIPVPPLADPLGDETASEEVARSYEVRNTTVASIFDFYEENLGGWTQIRSPEPTGASEAAATRAIWERNDRRLIVTVADAPTVDGASSSTDPIVQLSIVLEPADRPLPE